MAPYAASSLAGSAFWRAGPVAAAASHQRRSGGGDLGPGRGTAQAGCSVGSPSATTKDRAVCTGAPPAVTYGSTR